MLYVLVFCYLIYIIILNVLNVYKCKCFILNYVFKMENI